jgi:hypothetical protein
MGRSFHLVISSEQESRTPKLQAGPEGEQLPKTKVL